MLHEIFLSLLGFTGTIIIEGPDSFFVESSFDLLTSAEKQQINRVVPLGWYYARLTSFVVLYEVKWGVRSGDADSQFYRTAMSQGIADLLTEYTGDIAKLERLVQEEGPIPMSHVLHHLQKYLLIMPVIYNMWIEVEKRKIWGCQMLDFIKSKRSGVTVVDEIMQRMMVKVRAVFLKQCLAWMLYGVLEDPAEEFFIHYRGNSSR
jgi:gamma-tubulin complex component 4